MEKNIQDLNIENVSSSVWKLIWSKEYKVRTIIVIVIASLVAVFLGFVFSIFIVIYYLTSMYTKMDKAVMQQFAKNNGFTYIESAPVQSVSGRLFSMNPRSILHHVISGVYKDHPMRFFHYFYTVGSGKSKTTYNFTVFEIAFEKTVFPHILLHSLTMAKHGSVDLSGYNKDMQFPLEESFKDSFRLHATSGYEVEVFQIFTPEFLMFLKNKAAHFSIEFSDNKLYIYDDKIIRNKKGLEEMLSVVRGIFDAIGPLLNRLHNDFAVLHPYYKDNKD